MENALLVGLSRQVALYRELDAVANNIANLNTTGFKADGTVFEEYMMPLAREDAPNAADRRVSFVRDRATWHNLAQGSIQHTGSPLDVALEGEAFFVVQTAAGERYTRNGSFHVNAEGELVTSDGDRVMGENGPIQFQTTDNRISIDATGSIRVREGSNATAEAARGQLRIVTFDQPRRLQKDGSSRFMAPNDLVVTPAPESVRVIQGAIEKSNVQPVLEMTRMIDITRTYAHVAAMLQKQADMRQTAIGKLAEVPA